MENNNLHPDIAEIERLEEELKLLKKQLKKDVSSTEVVESGAIADFAERNALSLTEPKSSYEASNYEMENDSSTIAKGTFLRHPALTALYLLLKILYLPIRAMIWFVASIGLVSGSVLYAISAILTFAFGGMLFLALLGGLMREPGGVPLLIGSLVMLLFISPLVFPRFIMWAAIQLKNINNYVLSRFRKTHVADLWVRYTLEGREIEAEHREKEALLAELSGRLELG